ncbi:hypothetical protein WA158_001694 [Blastocystis sp. Blastoise]
MFSKEHFEDTVFGQLAANEGKPWDNLFSTVLDSLNSTSPSTNVLPSEFEDIIGSFPQDNNMPYVICHDCNQPILISDMEYHNTICENILNRKTLDIASINDLHISQHNYTSEFVTMTSDEMEKKMTEIKENLNLSL